MEKILTKSNYMKGLQCMKSLWIACNEKERLPKPGPAQQKVFDDGHLVGEYAKKLFPGGIDIPTSNFSENIRQTKEAVMLRKPLFEPGFIADRLFARADVLVPVGKDEWDIVEVKSSTKVKAEHIDDMAFQKYCYEKAGVKVRKCFLVHVNKNYVREGEIEPDKFLVKTEVTAAVIINSEGLEEKIARMLDVISNPKCPVVAVHENCKEPYPCALYDECWSFLPEGNVFELYYGGEKCFDLLRKGVLALKDIPDDYGLTPKQAIQKECAISGKAYSDREKVSSFISSLNYPLYFMDFETVSSAVPLYDRTRPYQQIPFQFSVHVRKEAGGALEHHEFLADGRVDPRLEFIKALKLAVGSSGGIAVFSKVFEQKRMEELCVDFPDECLWVDSVIKRMVDLIVPFKEYFYYSPLQCGSASLKKVLPALTGKDYSQLVIDDGQYAASEFYRIARGKVTVKEAEEIRKNLLKYCELDTLGMVWILDGLGKL